MASPRRSPLIIGVCLAPLLAMLQMVALLELSTVVPGPSSATLDLRRETSRQGAWIAFCARGESISGHGFVLLGEPRGASGEKPRWTDAFGYYPSEGIGLVGTVPGTLIAEDPAASVGRLTHQLRVRVDAKAARRLRLVLQSWEGEGNFRIASRDCVSLMAQLARDTGLQTPTRWSAPMPQTWVRALIAGNADREGL